MATFAAIQSAARAHERDLAVSRQIAITANDLRLTDVSLAAQLSLGIEGGIACFIALIFSIALIYLLPSLKPSEEMLALTGAEIPKNKENTV